MSGPPAYRTEVQLIGHFCRLLLVSPPDMRALQLFLCASLAFSISACSSDIGVTDVQFGSFSGVGTSTVTFRATTTFSKRQDAPFGWAFSMKNPPQQISVQEIVEGPLGSVWEAPPTASEVQVTDGGRTATVTKTFSKPSSPFLFHNWSISDSDPIGKYKAALLINGKQIRQVEFDVTN